MKYIIAFPALAIVIAAYLLMASGGDMMIDGDAYSMTLASGAEMTLRGGDIFVIAGLVALFLEMLKAARPGRAAVIDHILSVATFVVALVCFLLVDTAGTATFFILTLMTLVDVIAGFVVSLFSARRDFAIESDR
ncbi:hypothetical protein DK847_10805 [Aestuariivirga litoralis]|uniref:Uncharacterized protein n=1 Tax=Aestuariivirga litoralis TaxID=2650924 RepID=A0A2W2AWE2_9HYPH|nr:hypothetical protein [Aestuariivirga litoralis]PZF76940.1 hypothetical protein DK847_10805 [Aestuariivirga litoralis]